MAVRLTGLSLALLFCGCISDMPDSSYQEIKVWSDYHPEIAIEFKRMYSDNKISEPEYYRLRGMYNQLNKQKNAQSIMNNIKGEQDD
jgi:hypothetical protein